MRIIRSSEVRSRPFKARGITIASPKASPHEVL